MRILVAIATASLIPPASAVFYQLAVEDYSYGGLTIAFVAFVALCVGLAFTLAWGFPIHLALRRLRRRSVIWYAIAGASAGLIFSIFGPEWARSAQLAGHAYYAVTGALSAAAFWLVEVRGDMNRGTSPNMSLKQDRPGATPAGPVVGKQEL